MNYRTDIIFVIYWFVPISFAGLIACQGLSNPADQPNLAPPAELQVVAGSSSHFDLRWKDNSEGELGFSIERKSSEDSAWTRIGEVPANTVTYQSVGALASSTHVHRVRAYDENGPSAPSEAVEASTLPREDAFAGTIIVDDSERQGEGSFAKLSGGDLLLYYNYYPGVSGDEKRSTIYQKVKKANQPEWSEAQLVFEDKENNHSLLHPSLMRLANGELLVSYIRMGNLVQADGTHPQPGGAWAQRIIRKSTDEGRSWSEEIVMTDTAISFQGRNIRYISGSHDRMVQLSSGRLVYPVLSKDSEETPRTFYTLVYTSDDNGQTWQRRNEPFVVREGIEIRDNKGLSEPSVAEYEPGKLLMYMRAYSGYFYESRSPDGGNTWSAPVKSRVRASASPPKLFSIPGATAIGLIFNPYVNLTEMNVGYRRILASMVSQDGGITWENYREIAYGDPEQEETYDYPSLLFDGDAVHMTYMQGHPYVPRYIVYRKLPRNWFTQ